MDRTEPCRGCCSCLVLDISQPRATAIFQLIFRFGGAVTRGRRGITSGKALSLLPIDPEILVRSIERTLGRVRLVAIGIAIAVAVAVLAGLLIACLSAA